VGPPNDRATTQCYQNQFFLWPHSCRWLYWDRPGAADSKSDECGLASVYSTDSEATASGEDTQPGDFTAAHRSLPFGTLVHVNNQENGHSAIVRITDRGPFTSGRIIDLSKIAARELRISGLTRVCLNIPSTAESRPATGPPSANR